MPARCFAAHLRSSSAGVWMDPAAATVTRASTTSRRPPRRGHHPPRSVLPAREGVPVGLHQNTLRLYARQDERARTRAIHQPRLAGGLTRTATQRQHPPIQGARPPGPLAARRPETF